MKNNISERSFEKILADYETQSKWLMSLILDPTGSRYHEEKSDEQRLQEFEMQMDRTADFLEFAGNPEAKYKSIHVAGTSGKGSVTSMISAIMSANKIKTGYHVSPYLQVSNEKLIVNDSLISPSEFIELVGDFKNSYLNYTKAGRKYNWLKYGEAWVILTYIWLAMKKVDWAVIETGLGGRYDPTNVLPSTLAVLTNIDFDHVKSLGPSIEKIAWHKAGIIKENSLVVTTELKPNILEVFKNEAKIKNAKIYCLGEDFSFEIEEMNAEGAKITVKGPYHTYSNINLLMQGNFQPINATLAIASLDILNHHFNLPLTEESVQSGLGNLIFPGRMEIMQLDPFVMIDGAHNQHKMQALVESLKTLYPKKKITAVIGMLSTKDAAGMVKALMPIVDSWVATQPQVFGKPETPADEVAEMILGIDENAKIDIKPNILDAVELAIQNAETDELVLVTGSLYMIGDARNRWFPKEDLLRNLENQSKTLDIN